MHICITFVQCQPNIFDVGPTLYKCYTNILCLLRYCDIYLTLVTGSDTSSVKGSVIFGPDGRPMNVGGSILTGNEQDVSPVKNEQG